MAKLNKHTGRIPKDMAKAALSFAVCDLTCSSTFANYLLRFAF